MIDDAMRAIERDNATLKTDLERSKTISDAVNFIMVREKRSLTKMLL